MAPATPTAEIANSDLTSAGRRLVLIGGGEHARVVGDAARAAGWVLQGVVDPQPIVRTLSLLQTNHLGGDDEFASRLLGTTSAPTSFVLGMGAFGRSDARRILVGKFPHAQWATIVHPAASVSPLASLGDGAVVLAGGVVGAGAVVGLHCVINTAAVVDHDVQLGAFAQVGPGAVVGGGALIGDGAFIGIGALIRDHISVGAGAFVGMGSVVVGDVPPGVTVSGNPAKPRPDGRSA